jgi:hypothetical protein
MSTQERMIARYSWAYLAAFGACLATVLAPPSVFLFIAYGVAIVSLWTLI